MMNFSGQTIGQYELREMIGMGGMGSVYRAYQKTLKREVAVKTLSPLLAEQEGYMERFIQEAAVAARLEHNHIVPIYDYGNIQNLSFVVMRLLTGGTLSGRLKRVTVSKQGLPSLSESSTMLNGLANALDYAHSHGVIHRDVKPSNVMFDSQGNVYMVDFGIAKILESTHQITRTGAAIGTPAFMSPEQWQGETISPASDQYSLGVMMYTVLAGRPPFDAPTPYALMMKHMTQPPPPIHLEQQNIPPSISSVLERSMAKEPQNRFPSTMAFAHAFEEAIQDVPKQHTNFFTFQVPTSSFPTANPSQSTYVSQPVDDQSQTYFRLLVGVMVVLTIALFGLIGLLFLPSENGRPDDASDDQAALGAVEQTAVPLDTATLPSTDPAPTDSPQEVPTTEQASVDVVDRPETDESSTPVPPTVVPSPTNTPAPPSTEADRASTADAAPNTPVPTEIASNVAWAPLTRSVDGAEMVLVPTGCFMMGNPEGADDEQPVHEQCFSEGFLIDKTEVSRQQYIACVDAGACTAVEDSPYSSDPNQPINNVSWYQAGEFCAWRDARLPTEAEWEYAARGIDALAYPWGNSFSVDRLAFGDTVEAAVAVDQYGNGASWVGAIQLLGNVAEWVDGNYGGYPLDEDSPILSSEVRVVRGGSFNFFEPRPHAANRAISQPNQAYDFVGFRCARDE